MIAIVKLPESYKPAIDSGAAEDINLRLVLQHTNVSAVTLKIDPSIVLATRSYVDLVMEAHKTSRNHPYATTEEKGFVELATAAEAAAGTDDQRAVTPEGLTAARARDIGEIGHFMRDTPPEGWLVADGAAVSRTVYAALFGVIGTRCGAGDGSTTFNLPDLRGEWLRGADLGRGIDPGRAVGSSQGDAIGPHAHDTTGRYVYRYLDPGSGQNISHPYAAAGDPLTNVIADTGTGIDTETRPRNVAALACIRYR